MSATILKPIPFKWSWSALKSYRTCPKRHYEVNLQKNYGDPGGPNRKWGDDFHDAMAKRLSQKRMLPAAYKDYEQLADFVERRADGAQMRVELQIAINRKFQKCDYYDPEVWHRSRIDVLIKRNERVTIIDWKTGKVDPDTTQLMLNAACVFAHYPNVEVVSAHYVWIGDGRFSTTDDHFCRGKSHYMETPKGEVAVHSMIDLWTNLLPELSDMEKAYAERDFPATPSGLCKAHCSVLSCIHNGQKT